MGVHDGHRERLKERYLQHGLENFNDINALELLLFYAIPRKDTNPIAHALLDRFKTVDGVLSASPKELEEVEGIGESAALLITLVPQIVRRGMITKEEITQIKSSRDACEYFIPRYAGERIEILRMLCLDSQNGIICCTEIAKGTVNAVDTNIRVIVETALRNRTSSVILAHNHPDGIALPSREDIEFTGNIKKALKLMGIALVDHVIVAGGDAISFSESEFLR